MKHDTIIIYAIYFFIIFLIGLAAKLRTRNLSDYVLGGRNLNAFVTAMGAGASDMSGWLLLALPGVFYVHGLNQIWMPIGLIIGAYCNWKFIAPKLRAKTIELNDALTIPEYLSRRFNDHNKVLRMITAIAVILFFTLYAASGIVGAGILFQSSIGLSYHQSILLFTTIILLYTILGGYLAVNWVDTVQGSLMFFAILAVPLVTINHTGGWHHSVEILKTHSGFLNPWHNMNIIALFSLLGWGLGYMGQPHILCRFMSARKASDIPIARRVCMSWVTISLVGALAVGLIGRITIPNVEHPETIFLLLAKSQFISVIASILTAAVLSALMSTVAAQLLASASSLSEDVIYQFKKQKLSQKSSLWVGRISVAIIGLVALACAYDPKSNILNLVGYAWAGLGASFGPIILVSLWKENVPRRAAISGILVGAVTIVLWKSLGVYGGIFKLYELVPGFILSLAVILLQCPSKTKTKINPK